MSENIKWIESNIKIKDLVLWDENARFSEKYFNKHESELISHFCSNKSFKIPELAESITEEFDLPQLEKLVVYKTDNGNIVLEGNRRLTVYKLLANPEKAPDKKLNKKFKNLKEKIIIDDNYELECVITEDINEGYRFIERKHLHGNNEVGWGDVERTHHKNRRGTANSRELAKMELTKIVRSLDIPEEIKDKVLGPRYVTTFWRILNHSLAWKEYGYELNDKGNLSIKDKEFTQKLKVIIKNVLDRRGFNGQIVDSRSLNKSQEIESYIKSIKKENYSKATFEEEKEKTTETTIGSPPKFQQPSKGRSNSIPKGLFNQSNVPFKIDSSSLRILYEELRTLNVDNFPNAAHDLLRSFLECSLIVFFKKNGEFKKIQKNDKHNPTLAEMLSHIINGKCNAISDENLIQTINQIKSEWGQPYSLQRLNMVNHNENWVSTPKDVRSTWAKLEPLFKLILS